MRAPKPRQREERTGREEAPSARASGSDGWGGPDARWRGGREGEPLPQGLQAGHQKLPRARAAEQGLHGDEAGKKGLPEDARGAAEDLPQPHEALQEADLQHDRHLQTCEQDALHHVNNDNNYDSTAHLYHHDLKYPKNEEHYINE